MVTPIVLAMGSDAIIEGGGNSIGGIRQPVEFIMNICGWLESN